jgi:hypothetical protein
MMNMLSAKNASLAPEVEHNSSGASHNSVGVRRPLTWWLRTGLLLTVLLMTVGNILISAPHTNHVTLPLVEKLPVAQPSSNPPEKCELRDISNFTAMSLEPLKRGIQKNFPHCLRFQCMRNISRCDNVLATNFDGPDPPCCTHILRDKARYFDRVMCYLGLEYMPSAGMLLGLTRSDRMIPWTADNDFTVSTETMIAMLSLWHTSSHLEHGMLLFNARDKNFRLCASPSFANGKLLRWKVNGTSKVHFFGTSVYSDFYIGEYAGENMTVPLLGGCVHAASDLRPYVRRSFYNGTLEQYFPNNPENILTQLYGPNWRVPDPRKSNHGSGGGGIICGQNKKNKKQNKKVKIMMSYTTNCAFLFVCSQTKTCRAKMTLALLPEKSNHVKNIELHPVDQERTSHEQDKCQPILNVSIHPTSYPNLATMPDSASRIEVHHQTAHGSGFGTRIGGFACLSTHP